MHDGSQDVRHRCGDEDDGGVSPDVLVVVDVDLVELLRQQVVVHRRHVRDHLQDQEARQDGHDQTLLRDAG